MNIPSQQLGLSQTINQVELDIFSNNQLQINVIESQSLDQIEYQSLDYDESESICHPFNKFQGLEFNEDARRAEEIEDKENFADKIIDAFTVKKRKTFIDQENNEDHLVSYEASEQRLLILALILATVLSVICTTLLIFQVPNWNGRSIVIVEPKIPVVPLVRSIPHIIVLFKNGNVEALTLQKNGTLKYAWTFKVPQSKNIITDLPISNYDLVHVHEQTGYFMYAQSNQLFILYSDGQKNAIVLKRGAIGNDLKHSKLLNSKVPMNFFYTANYVPVGQHFWIFGGQIATNKDGCYGCLGVPQSQTLIWNTKKHVYYSGPDLPKLSLGQGCPISLNRTHVLVLVIDEKTKCIQGWMYSIQSYTWIVRQKCIYEITQPLDEEHQEMKGTSYLNKKQELQVLVMYNGKSFNPKGLEIILIDGKTFTSVRVEHTFTCHRYPILYSVTLVAMQNNIYLMHADCEDREADTLYISTLNGLSFEASQAVKVNQFSQRKVGGPVYISNEFNAISALL